MKEILLQPLDQASIAPITSAFEALGWNKPPELYATYLAEQARDARKTIVAGNGSTFLGYVTLKWASDYPPFRQAGIPEIKDLNVLPQFRRQGIGTELLEHAEQLAWSRSEVVGLGVGLTADYQDAFKLYLKRGYQLDGRGLYHPSLPGGFPAYGEQVPVDDDLNIWLIKARVVNKGV